MKILKRKPVPVEIGDLDATMRLPMSGRKGRMHTVCDVCGHEITDEFFIAGFKAGLANMKLHEACAPEPAPATAQAEPK